MARIYVTPRAGLCPRDPLQPNTRIPPEGDWREDSIAYRRLARTGDVKISSGPAASAVEPAPSKLKK